MNTQAPKIDPLRERLLSRELEEARAIFAEGGASALLRFASALLQRTRAAHDHLARLSRALEGGSPQGRVNDIARYLEETVTDARARAADLRALRGGEGGTLDFAALAERNARSTDALECRAEACLTIAARVAGSDWSQSDLNDVLALAETPGRFSRRTEALVVLRKLARSGLSELARQRALASTLRLSSPDEQRWVQPFALYAMAALDNGVAYKRARERLRSHGDGDDVLVRSMIVRLAARLRKHGWSDLIEIAAGDPSELVRMSAVRAEPRPHELARIAESDPSPKICALALMRLRRRAQVNAVDVLSRAALTHKSALVVQTAAAELTMLVRRTGSALPVVAQHALWKAVRRDELPAAVRRACGDALLELDVRHGPACSAHAVLERAVRTAPVGGSVRIASEVLARASSEHLARALAVLARDDFALGLDRTEDGALLHRGDRRGFAAWRALFEIRHPSPSKRQGVAHTLGYKPRGALRAPPGLLAEVTATRVPGERVLATDTGDWGRHLPLVDDLLSCGVWRGRPFDLASGVGLTRVVPAPSFWRRMRGLCRLTWEYADFAALRQQALASVDREVQKLYVREVERRTGIAIEIVPYAFRVSAAGGDRLRPMTPAASSRRAGAGARMDALLLGSLFPGVHDGGATLGHVWDELSHYALSPNGNRLSQLAAYALVLLGAMVARGIAIRGRIESERRAIPLVMGGWGTRGKSGTERLKAALFHGLGYEALVKTTGCEAMFIHALPGLPAREVFIYRPYDKASVWEQRETLALAHRLSVRVFLWECMALQPDLVGLLQGQWMRDDCSTITNAYPDHEDVQGPTGLDVATTISEFVPAQSRLFTSEEQMLPVLQEQARTRGTQTNVVRARDAELIPDELLQRFGYAEHPQNIALVAALARSFGIPETVAIAEMADNVVPDLGALKTYPTVAWCGRGLSFTNGMGANDRQGTLSNWRRGGFAAHDPDAEPGRWIVTLVNNRADRVARSEVFAKLIVEDIAAHCHVLIGTNVSGLLGLIETALRAHLECTAPCRNLPDDILQRRDVVRQRIARAFARLKLGRTDTQSVIAECRALGFSAPARDRIEVLLTRARAGESYEDGRQVVLAALRDDTDAERLPFLTTMIARRRCVRALRALVGARVDSAPAVVDAAFVASYRAMFMERLLPLHDPELSGDAILDRIARIVPSGAHASIMGMQNIKGTGLDFAYRWVSIDSVTRASAGLRAGTQQAREQALTQLMVHDDYGMIDAELALLAVERARAKAAQPAAGYDAAIARLREVVRTRNERMAKRRESSRADRVRKVVGETLDFVDAVRRRRMATRVMRELVAGRISHATAALRMRRIVARSMGAWMVERK